MKKIKYNDLTWFQKNQAARTIFLRNRLEWDCEDSILEALESDHKAADEEFEFWVENDELVRVICIE